MFLNSYYFEKSQLIRVAVLCSILLTVIFLLHSFFLSTRALERERLKAVAELSTGLMQKHLQQTSLKDTDGALQSFSKKYSLDGVELYRSDGSILTTSERAKKQNESFVIGEDSVYKWPLVFMFQHSKIFFQDGRPLGFLILYSSLNKQASMWIGWGGVFILLVSAALFYTLFLQRLTWGGGGKSDFKVQRKIIPDQTGAHSDICHSGGGSSLEDSELVEQLRHERDMAVASAKAKGHFLATMSHEIRTSMNGVIGILSILQKSGLKSERRRLLDAAARSADSLLLIINDILDFSKIESGKIDFENIEFDLRQVLEESITLYIDTARVKNIGLHCYIPLEICTRVMGDPTRLRQIVTNLLSNAVKFTSSGAVDLAVTVLEAKPGSQRLKFTIDDTGIGIVPEKQETIFDMFIQADSSTTRQFGGTGLGLNICKQLVELQNGTVGVNSRYGIGSSFWFILDFETMEAGDNNYEKQQWLKDKKIILFDSCETCSTIISQYLKGCSIKVQSAKNADDILIQLQQILEIRFVPDVLLVNYPAIANDINSFVDQIASLFPGDPPELIALSWRDGTEEKLWKQGFSSTVYKPLQLQQLREALLGSRECENDENLQERQESLSGNVLLVDDERINLHVGEMILNKIGLTVDVAVSGEQALKMTENTHYDIVMMDVQMPEFSGLEATEALRRREEKSGAERHTIIAVTANVLSNIKTQCYEAGMDDFISKPIKPDVLINHLRPWLEGKKRSEINKLPEGLGLLKESNEVINENNDVIWDRQLALEYLGGDERLLEDLMKLFLMRKNILLSDIEEAMASADGEAINCAAHAFKGAVNHFAAKRCQRIAQKIENKAGDGELKELEVLFDKLKKEVDVLAESLEKCVE